ncbi:hypothetical protein SARC_10477 [Sphaeroforma arctica JP610]|uniref:DUF1088 domain-containing protein n=1 Tax=Sphaeroforma arctica JP610 TaxID=667725 RepID=A0A0L0FKR0_9EUKA|nr:hypothetical protein SARC_10477 [Sphaeroforma arctica JP610]KNC77051.1 hypothetical protein SARC_10477 [Sphaeroforma arctica JP610]|eukprot:XP_014150953.1 hypothetical protein SARC_10477 [Sphaeroforma arctica JP610]
MRPLMVEKDFLRLRAVLYRDFDDYIANAQRLVLIVLRFVTRLVLDRYMHLLGVQGSSTAFTRTTSLGSLGYHGNQAASPPAMSVYFSAAFPRALHLFRELVSDFHSYLAKNLLTSHKRSVVTSADSLFKTKGTESGSSAATEDESINTAIIMFMCSTDWLDAIRMQADPEWTQTTEEVAKTWERLSERLHAHATANNKVQSGQVNRRVHVNMAFEAFFVRCRERLMRRKGWGQKQRIEMAVALRLWLQLTDKLRYSLGNTRAIGNKSEGYWKLDTHEDLLRRRMRMVPNHAGSSHPEAILRKKGDSADRQADEHTGEDKSYDAPSRGPVLPKGIKVARDFKGVRWGKVGDPQQQSTEGMYFRLCALK